MDEQKVVSQSHGFIVLIEWDGRKAPTSWYTFLFRNGLQTGRNDGDPSESSSPISRRVAHNGHPKHGIAFQEGAIIVNSGSMAHQIAAQAKWHGATTVSIGSVSLTPFQMSDTDKEALEKALAITTKRGPKAKSEEGRYAIFCIEEGTTHLVDLRNRPVECPSCGSSQITWRRSETGKAVKSFNPDTDNLFDYWLATRFTSAGTFEVPVKQTDGGKLPAKPDTKKFDARTRIAIDQTVEFEKKYEAQIDGAGFLTILRAMDMAYCVQHLDNSTRLAKRISALQEFYAGGKRTVYPMAIDELAVDMVDVAAMDYRFVEKL